jgi:alpha-ribazole phosphatase
MGMTTLDFLRHGEPVGGRKYRGQTDDPLSENGWRQMWQAVADSQPWTGIVSSPLSRCADFACKLSERSGIPMMLEERLKEVAFGEWEGRFPGELTADNPDLLFDFKRDPVSLRPQGAETFQVFFERVNAAMEDIYRTHAGGHVLIICHAGVIRMAMARVLGMPLTHVYRIHVANSAITRIVREERTGKSLESLVFHDGRLS